jgi:riboflavin kinase / FMN adenylyltransferase
MQIYTDDDLIIINKPVVTVGTFDGVHVGHQHIFRQLIKSADEIGGESVIITLWPHPRMIVHPGGTEIMILNTLEEKIELIKSHGIKHFVILRFNNEFAMQSSSEFIRKYLHEKIGIKGLIMGYDHRFGRDRMGDSLELHGCAQKYGFFIKNIDPFCQDHEKISSTRIRNALFDGEIENANAMLSRIYSISGHVEGGYRIGRIMGFPTANIRPDYNYKLVPKDGVYAVKVKVNSMEYLGMLNIGLRPTVNKGNENKSIEVHLLGFNGDIYGTKIKLLFYKRIRNEMKFNSLEELKIQLEIDRQMITDYFNQIES